MELAEIIPDKSGQAILLFKMLSSARFMSLKYNCYTKWITIQGFVHKHHSTGEFLTLVKEGVLWFHFYK